MVKFISLSLLISCASNYRPPESFGEKMGRYSSKTKHHNIIPKSYAMDINYNNIKRKIASVEEEKKIQVYPNSVFYFISLYTQFKQIQNFSQKKHLKLKRCPRFHGDYLKIDENQTSSVEFKVNYTLSNRSLLYDENFLAKNPVFLLPLDESDHNLTVRDMLEKTDYHKANQLIDEALLTQQIKILNELEELCEDGVSDNFYAYQNLITHINNRGNLSPSKENMSILLKTSLFFNKALIESLKMNSDFTARSISSTDDADNQLFLKMKVDWAEDYLKNLR